METASNSMPPPAPQLPSPSPRSPNLRNPLPLSAAQEAQVKDIYYRRVRNKCAAEIKDFADCARSRTVTATWLCRAQRLAMNSCMIAHATPSEEDAAREEWFAARPERRKKKEIELAKVEERRLEVIDLTKRQEDKERIEMEQKKQLKDNGKTTKGWWG